MAKLARKNRKLIPKDNLFDEISEVIEDSVVSESIVTLFSPWIATLM